jgi:hypothetical protein
MKRPLPAAPSGRDAHPTEIDASEILKLNGRVTSGRGVSTANVGRNAGRIHDALGTTVVEGSLNILLKRPVMLANETAIPMRFDRGQLRLDWPGRLNGIDVWVHRWQTAPLHVVELLSAVHLRTHLNLSNGDEVQIEMRQRDVERLSVVGWLTWILFWSGRKSRTFRRDADCAQAHRWCRRFGASQLGTDKNSLDLAMALTKALIRRIPGARLLKAGL